MDHLQEEPWQGGKGSGGAVLLLTNSDRGTAETAGVPRGARVVGGQGTCRGVTVMRVWAS